MDPNIVVSSLPPTKQISRRWLLLIPLIIVVLVVGFFGYQYYLAYQAASYLAEGFSQTNPTGDSAINYGNYSEAVNRDVKQTFTGSKYSDIIDYINLASSTNDPFKSYDYYKKAYSKMSLAYQETKNTEFKIVMLELKEYLKYFSNYKETDFPIP